MNSMANYDANRRDSRALSRRAWLQGVGVSMALPWMESMAVWGQETASGQPSSEAPVRLAILFAGNGFHAGQWWAKENAGQTSNDPPPSNPPPTDQQTDRAKTSKLELGRVLAPLQEFSDSTLFIRGLYNAEALKGNIHSSQTGNLLSGAPLSAGGEIRSGTSIDQMLAQSVGRQTKVPSLVLGCEKSNPSVHKNYSMIYSSHISWSSPTTPTPLELYPALAFDRLFKDENHRGDQSVLDSVLEHAGDIRRQISSSDRQKFDEYLDSVRDVEQRIANAGQRGELQGWKPTLDKPNIDRPADGIPQDISEHMRLMCDILVLGFQTDTTHHHLETQQRPFLVAIPSSWDRLHDPPSALALRHRGLVESQSVLHRAGRLHRTAIEQDPRGRAHGTGQLDDHALFEHDERQSRCDPAPGRDGWQRRGQDPDRQGPRLPPKFRTADVPTVSLDDAKDGDTKVQFRRCDFPTS